MSGTRTQVEPEPEPVLAVHGGAGRLRARRLEPSGRSEIERALHDALEAGRSVLLGAGDAGDAMEAVVAAVRVLEDAACFNAGRGSDLCRDGTVELSASVMRGSDRAAGAVAGVRSARYPVEVARSLLDHRHVLLVGDAADLRARESGIETMPADWFVTQERLEQWRARSEPVSEAGGGTVGAVARDARGRLAAATSTGGVGGQLPGRVGDSPSIGAGTWADDAVCAVSATGHGESFMRAAFAHRVADLIELSGLSLERAARQALDEVGQLEGSGGCVAIDAHGQLTLPFTTPHMTRGWLRGSAEAQVAILPTSADAQVAIVPD